MKLIAPIFALTTGPLFMAACTPAQSPPPQAASPQDAFWSALSSHCGNAYAGKLVSTDAADADMQGAAMVMHVRECTDTQIKVPFHIRQSGEDWNRSRTWVFTRTDGGLRLKHDHRHRDGESDAVTMYGGDTAAEGTARRQDFAVDAESIALFQDNDLGVSVTNVWRVEVDPAGTTDGEFTYNLIRTLAGGAPEPRNFRVVFDAARPVDTPPAPWGFETAE